LSPPRGSSPSGLVDSIASLAPSGDQVGHQYPAAASAPRVRLRRSPVRREISQTSLRAGSRS
jgi:hypothetical protein